MSLSPFKKTSTDNSADANDQTGAEQSSSTASAAETPQTTEKPKVAATKAKKGPKKVSVIDAKIEREMKSVADSIQSIREAFDGLESNADTSTVRGPAMRKMTEGLASSYESILGMMDQRHDVVAREKQNRVQKVLGKLLSNPAILSDDVLKQIEAMTANNEDAAIILKTLANGMDK